MTEARHKQIVASVLSGNTDEMEGRKLVAALVVESGAAAQVAKETSAGVSEQEIADITVSINDRLVDKIIGKKPAYEFSAAANGTLAGWAMNYGRKIKVTSTIDLIRENHRYTPFSHYATEDDDAENRDGTLLEKHAAGGAWTTQSTNTTDEEEAFELAIELLGENRRGLRESGRLFVDASVLCMAYQFPFAVRIPDFHDRDFVRQELLKDKTAAHWSLHDFHEIASLEMDASDSAYDPRLLSLWEDFSLAEADLLLSLPSAVAHTIALAASSPKPKPAGRDLNKFRSELRKTIKSEGWEPLSRKLADSYIATEYEAFSEFNTRALDAIAVRDHQRAIHDFPVLLAAVANFPGHPLGVTPTAIRKNLTSVANAVLGNVFVIDKDIKKK